MTGCMLAGQITFGRLLAFWNVEYDMGEGTIDHIFYIDTTKCYD